MQKVSHETVRNPASLEKLLNEMQKKINSLITAVNEINTWAETLAAKINADSGDTGGDADYDATIAAGQITSGVSGTN